MRIIFKHSYAIVQITAMHLFYDFQEALDVLRLTPLDDDFRRLKTKITAVTVIV